MIVMMSSTVAHQCGTLKKECLSHKTSRSYKRALKIGFLKH